MRDETFKYLTQRAEQSGLTVDQLTLEPDVEMWEIFIVFGGALDEEIRLGKTLHEVNIVDWLAEHCAIEATVGAHASGNEPEAWNIELYTAERFEGDSPIYRVNSEAWYMEHGTPLCSWNAGGDPASGCDKPVTGHDMLCNEHRKAYKILSKTKEG